MYYINQFKDENNLYEVNINELEQTKTAVKQEIDNIQFKICLL